MLLLGMSACVTLMACTSPQQRVASAIIDARRLNAPLPQPHRIDETLTIERSYRIQKHLVQHELGGATPAGFKAGLTSLPAQQRFRASTPVAGVLNVAGQREPGATMRLSELRGLMIETEVALRVGKPIRRRVTSLEELRAHIDAIAPAIELPNLHYQDIQALDALDIVATNVAAAAYITGAFVETAQRDPNEAQPQLTCNGQVVNSGKARDALGDQWQAAMWLVNTVIGHGWTLEPGQILLTGALGRMVPATVGACSASYGSWGTIELRIAP